MLIFRNTPVQNPDFCGLENVFYCQQIDCLCTCLFVPEMIRALLEKRETVMAKAAVKKVAKKAPARKTAVKTTARKSAIKSTRKPAARRGASKAR